MKKQFLTAMLLLTLAAFGQEKVSDIALNINKRAMFFEIVDAKSKELLFYHRGERAARVLKTNDKFEVVDSLMIENPDEKIFTNYIGNTKTGDNYSIYWANNTTSKIFYQSVNFNSKERKKKIIELNFEKERFLKAVSIGNKLLLLTMPKNGNSITFHKIEEDRYTKKSIEFTGKMFFYKRDQSTKQIWDVFNEGYLDVTEIPSDFPASLPMTLNRKKLYVINDNELLFTLDGNNFVTQLLRININENTFTLDNYKKHEPSKEELIEGVNTNSFVCNDKLFQISSTSSSIHIDIKKFDSETLKSYSIFKDKDIDFINSDIIQENFNITNTRYLDKSSQFVRKLDNLIIGITSTYKNGKYYTTIGGFSLLANTNGSVLIGSALGGMVGGIIVASLTQNNQASNINSYANRQVVYVNTVLDENFNNLAGKQNRFAFDDLRQFVEDNNKLHNQMVFKFDATTYFGGYDYKSKILSLYKFNQ